MTQAAIIFCVILMMTALEEFTGLVSSETVHDVRIWSIGGPYLSNFAAVVVTCFVVLFSLFTYRHIELPWQAVGKGRRPARQHKSASFGTSWLR
ncbi:hypothetical protein CDEF62S_00129 [Castellaniella defragrans]